MHPQRFLRDQFHAYRMWILERRCPQAPAALVVPAGIELAFLHRHARRDWACARAADHDWPQYRVALEHDHDLIVARRGAETIGWAWIGYERVYLPPLGRDIRLAPDTGYLYDAYVRPTERGAGIGRALVAARCRHADERGIERMLSHVLTSNEPSLRSLRACGFEPIGRTVFLRALALRLWTREPLPAPHAA
jgi:ribosomal protein S18 acetylase RimI-like enzyme